MAAGDYNLGLDGIFLYDAPAGATAATVADNVDDVNLSMSKRVAEAIRRGKSWVAKKPFVTEAKVEFKVLDIEADVFLAAIRSAFVNDTRIALYPRTHATGQGLDADFYITGFTRNEDNEGFISYSVVAEPTDEVRDPVYQ